jgi:hypothetical protein
MIWRRELSVVWSSRSVQAKAVGSVSAVSRLVKRRRSRKVNVLAWTILVARHSRAEKTFHFIWDGQDKRSQLGQPYLQHHAAHNPRKHQRREHDRYTHKLRIFQWLVYTFWMFGLVCSWCAWKFESQTWRRLCCAQKLRFIVSMILWVQVKRFRVVVQVEKSWGQVCSTICSLRIWRMRWLNYKEQDARRHTKKKANESLVDKERRGRIWRQPYEGFIDRKGEP